MAILIISLILKLSVRMQKQFEANHGDQESTLCELSTLKKVGSTVVKVVIYLLDIYFSGITIQDTYFTVSFCMGLLLIAEVAACWSYRGREMEEGDFNVRVTVLSQIYSIVSVMMTGLTLASPNSESRHCFFLINLTLVAIYVINLIEVYQILSILVFRRREELEQIVDSVEDSLRKYLLCIYIGAGFDAIAFGREALIVFYVVNVLGVGYYLLRAVKSEIFRLFWKGYVGE